jgi:hypothetical protein
MNVRESKSSTSYQLGLDIEPGTIGQKQLEEGLLNIRTIPGLAKTWAEHYEKAVTLYQACGLDLVYFSPSDTGFQQVKKYYSEHGQTLVFADALGMLHYRIKGSHETKSQNISAVVIIMVDPECP